jgi:hypothetical protein
VGGGKIPVPGLGILNVVELGVMEELDRRLFLLPSPEDFEAH